MTRIAPCTALARVTTVLATAREASTGPTVDGRKPNPGSSRVRRNDAAGDAGVRATRGRGRGTHRVYKSQAAREVL